MSGTLRVERVLEASPERVWQTMTHPDHARRWLEASGFEARVGHRFTARLPRGPGFDGTVQAEVLEVDPPRRLRLWWSGGPVSGEVRLELHPTSGGGTRVTVDQTGFDRQAQGVLAPTLSALWAERLTAVQSLVGGAAAGGLAAGAGTTVLVASLGGLTALVGLLLAILAWFAWGPSVVQASLPATSPAAPSQQAAIMPDPSPETPPASPTRAVHTRPRPPGASPPPPSRAVPVRRAGGDQFPVVGDGHAMNPVFSHDGRHLAYELNSYGGDGIALYFVALQGFVATKTTSVKLPGSAGPYGAQQVVMNPTWHPQGIAVFEGSAAGGRFRLFFVQPGGASAAEMLSTAQAPGNLQFPALAPGGDRLAYTTDEHGKSDVVVWHRKTDRITRLTRTRSVSEAYPTFDATGTRMAWVVKGDAGAFIEIADAATGRVLHRIRGPGDQTRPVFAGDRVLYFSSPRSDAVWDLMAWHDGTSTPIARDVKLPERARPAVSPDGALVAWASARRDLHDSIFLAPVLHPKRVERIPTSFQRVGEVALGRQGDTDLLAYTFLPDEESDWRSLAVVSLSD